MATGKIIPKRDITQESLKEFLHYDPATGEFTWLKLASPGRTRVGDKAGCPDERGYITIGFRRGIYKRHRLAWLYMTGKWPSRFIDHIDGVAGNDRWGNLREADDIQNQQNVKGHRLNKSGCPGVCWHKTQKRWFSYIMASKKRVHLGCFKNFDEAVQARLAAETRYFGEFAPNNPQPRQQQRKRQ